MALAAARLAVRLLLLFPTLRRACSTRLSTRCASTSRALSSSRLSSSSSAPIRTRASSYSPVANRTLASLLSTRCRRNDRLFFRHHPMMLRQIVTWRPLSPGAASATASSEARIIFAARARFTKDSSRAVDGSSPVRSRTTPSARALPSSGREQRRRTSMYTARSFRTSAAGPVRSRSASSRIPRRTPSTTESGPPEARAEGVISSSARSKAI
mmetsp:Transcript_14520/g.29061  ORF Transcript_14520/g.29061 Transcript_14520/m.29061 type:complete len:213 (-) Transcript_14520:293-931(-)